MGFFVVAWNRLIYRQQRSLFFYEFLLSGLLFEDSFALKFQILNQWLHRLSEMFYLENNSVLVSFE